MESKIKVPELTSSEVMARLRALGVVRVTASSLGGLGISDGNMWIRILLSQKLLRPLSSQEIANSQLSDPYDVVQEDGTVVAQKDLDRSGMVRRAKPKNPDQNQKAESIVIRTEKPVKADPKWMDFWFRHPEFRCSPISGDLYILSQGKDIEYDGFCKIILQRKLGNAWIPSRMHLARKLGHIDPKCKGSRYRPISAILWNQDQIPPECKRLLERLLIEFRQENRGAENSTSLL